MRHTPMDGIICFWPNGFFLLEGFWGRYTIVSVVELLEVLNFRVGVVSRVGEMRGFSKKGLFWVGLWYVADFTIVSWSCGCWLCVSLEIFRVWRLLKLSGFHLPADYHRLLLVDASCWVHHKWHAKISEAQKQRLKPHDKINHSKNTETHMTNHSQSTSFQKVTPPCQPQTPKKKKKGGVRYGQVGKHRHPNLDQHPLEVLQMCSWVFGWHP